MDDELEEDHKHQDGTDVLPEAEFMVQWRDFDEEAMRVCGKHLPETVRNTYKTFGFTFAVEVYLLNPGNGFICELESDHDPLEEWAATQPPDNFVNMLACGHEVDTADEYPVGAILKCSVHGAQRIIDPADPTS